jgi:hypothetical protein
MRLSRDASTSTAQRRGLSEVLIPLAAESYVTSSLGYSAAPEPL